MDLSKAVITPTTNMDTGNAYVIGCGGIGARLFPSLVKLLARPAANRMVYGMNGVTPWVVFAVDPDRVEERNIIRQPFVKEDIGRYKAEVMAERYTTPDVTVIPITMKVEDAWDAMHNATVRNHNARMSLYFGALDSPVPREWIKNKFRRAGQRRGGIGDGESLPSTAQSMHLYIDAGNDGNRGQVVIGSALLGTQPIGSSSRYTLIDGFPLFPEVFKAPPAREQALGEALQGCALQIDTQTPLANNMAAALSLNYLGLVLNQQPIGSIGVTFSTLGSIEYLRGERQYNSYHGWNVYGPQPRPVQEALPVEASF